MPVKHFLIDREAGKKARKLPLHVHKKVERAFARLKENPLAGIRLRGKLDFAFKYRVGDYRIVYSFEVKTKTLVVLKIEHRQGVYR